MEWEVTPGLYITLLPVLRGAKLHQNYILTLKGFLSSAQSAQSAPAVAVAQIKTHDERKTWAEKYRKRLALRFVDQIDAELIPCLSELLCLNLQTILVRVLPRDQGCATCGSWATCGSLASLLQLPVRSQLMSVKGWNSRDWLNPPV